jgi:hypothetical protein
MSYFEAKLTSTSRPTGLLYVLHARFGVCDTTLILTRFNLTDKILGVSPTATQQQIRDAYKRPAFLATVFILFLQFSLLGHP